MAQGVSKSAHLSAHLWLLHHRLSHFRRHLLHHDAVLVRPAFHRHRRPLRSKKPNQTKQNINKIPISQQTN